MGGYSEAILKYLNTKVIALDRDSSTTHHAEKLKKKFPKRFTYFNTKFSNINEFFKLKKESFFYRDKYCIDPKLSKFTNLALIKKNKK